ncbi:MAG: FAD synthetase family protein [Treponema sp.]|jgi:riboflavin kinase/FMN adenylyltransferase|nr:FAD synthetase family protein [Treponema sp.]
MQVVEWGSFIEKNRTAQPETAMTIGVFDGVHRGHQRLIEKIVRQGPNPTAVTFRQSPKRVISPDAAGGAILSLSQKLGIFERLGVLQTILIDFSEDFSKLKGQEFIDLLIKCGNLTYLVVGSNFKCGYQLDTDAGLIKQLNDARGIKTDVVPPVLDGAYPVSSSRIRRAIAAGDLAGAQAGLGRYVAVDLTGTAPECAGEEVFFDLASQGRVLPPDGRYPSIAYEINITEGKKTEIRLDHGKLFIPSAFNPVRGVELLSGSQGE